LGEGRRRHDWLGRSRRPPCSCAAENRQREGIKQRWAPPRVHSLFSIRRDASHGGAGGLDF
jgi:hypothetical protein